MPHHGRWGSNIADQLPGPVFEAVGARGRVLALLQRYLDIDEADFPSEVLGNSLGVVVEVVEVVVVARATSEYFSPMVTKGFGCTITSHSCTINTSSALE